MSKQNEINDARLLGMDYAYRQIKKIGLEEFEKELRWRMKHGISLRMTPEELNKSSLEFRQQFVGMTVCVSIMVLCDEFDFDREMLKRFEDRYNVKQEAILSDYVSWDDYIELVQELTGEDFGIKWVRR